MSDLEILVREARELDAEIKELTEKKSSLIERIKAELKVGDALVVDGVRASLREGNRKFNLKLALDILPEDVRLSCIRPMIDEKLVRQTVEAMGQLDAAMEKADPSKTVFDLTK